MIGHRLMRPGRLAPFGRSARALFDRLAEIILPKTSREDFDYAHARGRATPLGLRTRTMGLLLRWPALEDYIAELEEELQDAEEHLKDLEK
jgi:hypothetical protein